MQIRVAFFEFLKKPITFFFKCEKQQCNVAAVTKNIDQINKTITHVPKKNSFTYHVLNLWTLKSRQSK